MAHGKDDFKYGISKPKREIISTHIQEYKRQEVDQSEISEMQQNVSINSKKANMSIREYSRKRKHNQRNGKTHTHTNFYDILTNGIPK